MRCDTQEDLDIAYGCLPLAAGVIVIGVVFLVFGGFNLFLAATSNEGGFMLILAYIIEALICLCGIYCIVAACISHMGMLGAVPQIVNIGKIAIFLITVVQWGQWLYLMYGPRKWRPGAFNLTNMIISTVLAVWAIAMLCHGKSVAASIVLQNNKGKTGWEMPNATHPGPRPDLEQGRTPRIVSPRTRQPNPDTEITTPTPVAPMVKKAPPARKQKTMPEEEEEEAAYDEEEEEE
eukprot:Gregarina_sp_Poly_1__11323@NODE_948_length_5588_cov_118_430538_g672_i0_p4_GENE_NODE_948_length_5588_cov_118_430538_g672_i0NODE_948_length_5588_cov_118_430538_g672_i0_p4_ORF_typecomplete_len235_score34_92SirB/PF04247_12/23SirB/PF04247_12/2_4DmsC/PF04976_12/5_NODE_948_length_5588_cov_118_430538_g672_i04201124